MLISYFILIPTLFDEADHIKQRGCPPPMELSETSFERNEEIPLKLGKIVNCIIIFMLRFFLIIS